MLLAAPAASADPEHEPGQGVPGVSPAPYYAPPLTLPHGRKLS